MDGKQGTHRVRRARVGWVLLALVLVAACRPQPAAPPDAEAPPPGPRAESGTMDESLRDGESPPGVYFLHTEHEGVRNCVFIGERETGSRPLSGRADAEEARARAVLDMAEQTRWMGGNVVVLPDFQADFQAGRLRGRVYRCGEAQRRELYRKAAASETLTVIGP